MPSRPVPKSAPRLPRSAPARLEFAWEDFSAVAKEVLPMFVSHWKEVAINHDRVPLDVDVPRLLQYERMGCLGIVTARDGKRIVGYVVVLMGPHLHHASTKWGQFDGFWLEPEWRTGLVGYRLLQNAVRMAKEKDVQVLTVPVKTHFANGRVMKLFERLGFCAEDVLYSKVL